MRIIGNIIDSALHGAVLSCDIPPPSLSWAGLLSPPSALRPAPVRSSPSCGCPVTVAGRAALEAGGSSEPAAGALLCPSLGLLLF